MSAQNGARPTQVRFGTGSPEDLVPVQPRDIADIRTQLRRIADALEAQNDRRTAEIAAYLPDIETR